ncbi:MAG: dipeptide ABC transporter ATP-binding protein [Pseudomonadota bacterium]
MMRKAALGADGLSPYVIHGIFAGLWGLSPAKKRSSPVSSDLATRVTSSLSTADHLVAVEELVKHFIVGGGFFRGKDLKVHAVDGVDLAVRKGETLGLVGESGCGKSTLGRLILGLIRPSFGRVIFEGRDITNLSRAEMKPIRREMQIIFQDPYSALNPRHTIGTIIGESLTIHSVGTPAQRRQKVLSLLEEVGLRPEAMKRYPHEFSGGQRQRIGIARALALNPKLIVADEPVSALDVSIRSQVLNLMEDLQEKYRLTYLFISHDLSVVEHISDRVAVMYLGRIVEIGENDDIFDNCLHPYTEALLSAVPVPDPEHKQSRIILEGDVPSPLHPPTGCRFHPRCRLREELCSQEDPELVDVGNGHLVACRVRAPSR